MTMDQTIFPETAYIDEQGQSITQQNNGWMYSAMYTDYTFPESDLWSPSTLTYQQLSQQRFSNSTHSSFATNPRTSLSTNASSQWQPSSSSTSTRSSWSNPVAQRSRQASLGSTTDFQSSILIPDSTAAKASLSPAPSSSKRKASQRHLSPEKDKDHFATCVSRRRRTRRSQREPRYWCTSCEEPFVEKYDWKRHEETYQERRFVFSCSLCSASYFLEKDFVHHHKTRHNCETCQRDEHHEAARQELQARTGWGCGFCMHFSSDWKERCNHIAQHFEGGRTMDEWYHSNVIQSLLQRPTIRAEWNGILHSQPQLRADFGWNQRNTGRTEGYPESHAQPHLQDLLEYYRPGDNAFELAQLAFRKIAFPARPPQAPRKDYKDHHTATLQSLMDDSMAWDRLMSTIPEDDVPPTAVCELGFDIARGAFAEDGFNYF